MSDLEKKEVLPIEKAMVIAPTSTIGKMIKAEKYEEFVELMEKQDNFADAIMTANKQIAIKLQVGIDAKNIVDTLAKPMKEAVKRFREYTLRYMEEKELDKLEGDVKNITFQPKKETKSTVAYKQVKIGAKYIDIDQLSKDDLIEELEKLGGKTRVRTDDVTDVKPASITIPKQ